MLTASQIRHAALTEQFRSAVGFKSEQQQQHLTSLWSDQNFLQAADRQDLDICLLL